MRGTRAKKYRKLMNQYALTFNFREPYQVLLDKEIIQDAARFKMDLVGGLERTLQGKVKPMVTQCSMRHLYTAIPKDPLLIEQAKSYERRRCNHHTLEQPLSELECLSSVVDPKGSRTNKHRYVVASQHDDIRRHMRQIPGVPLIYINRSVMILEPMAGATEDLRDREEKDKFRSGLKGKRGGPVTSKRKRDGDGEVGDDGQSTKPASDAVTQPGTADGQPTPKKRKRGPKGPNPLSVRKPKKRSAQTGPLAVVSPSEKNESMAVLEIREDTTNHEPSKDGATEGHTKRKRKRKHKGQTSNEPKGSNNGDPDLQSVS